jgi:hypothetical protein
MDFFSGVRGRAGEEELSSKSKCGRGMSYIWIDCDISGRIAEPAAFVY